ncbi:MAG: methionyl-tRNA formyltransferase [Planctomycetes bacterium]|nr:methionyl-tRNA formyltransferase [Planctomycetota bacterium]
MRLAFLGTGDFAAPALRALVEAGHQALVAISQPDRPAGRGRAVRPTPVHAVADELGVTHVQTADVNALDLQATFGAAQVGVVAAFGQKIGQTLLDTIPSGCINIHGSLLPRYRGAAPIQRAIINGDEKTGVTIFQLDRDWDSGAVWTQRETSIAETETADELHDRLAQIGAALVVETLTIMAAGQTRPHHQDPAAATRARKLSRADGIVDWTQTARLIVRRIHGLWSWPVATCTFASHSGKRERVQLARAEVADPGAGPRAELVPGAFCEDGTVQAGTGRVRLLEVKPAGGKLMSFEAFARGRQVQPPDRLLPLEAS